MHTSDLVKGALESLRRNTSRSLLTILGIVIGIAAVIVMLSVGQGAQNYILGQVSDLGADQIYIEAAHDEGSPNPYVEQTLTLDDAATLRASGAFAVVSAAVMTSTQVSAEDTTRFLHVMGVEEYELEAFPASVAYGRFLDADDVGSTARVAVLGDEIARDFFGDGEALGKRIVINDVRFRVVGVMEERGTQFFQNLDTTVYIPVTTMQHMFGYEYVHYLSLRAKGNVDDAKDEAALQLRDAHGLGADDADDFFISSQEDAVAIIGTIGTVLSLLLSSIAAISLVVGGIGIMNIMLVSVTERTREIGLRKAIGATYGDIMRQFLLESVLLTLTGGVMGIALGALVTLVQGAVVGRFVEGWSPTIPPSAIVLAVAVSSVIGIVFGIYPARRAAKLDPIEALRYE